MTMRIVTFVDDGYPPVACNWLAAVERFGLANQALCHPAPTGSNNWSKIVSGGQVSATVDCLPAPFSLH